MKTSPKGFSQRISVLLVAFVFGVFGLFSTGCDKPETIPAFIKVDSVSFVVEPDQGGNASKIEDLWVFADEEFLGAFPIPAEIPILKSGPTDIRIEPGIRINGLAGARSPNPFYSGHEQTISLIEDSSVNLTPTFQFDLTADFAWIEDFEDAGITLVSTPSSYADVERVNAVGEAFQGETALFRLQESQQTFECASDVYFDLPGSGNTVMLEFQYRGNNSLVVGTIIQNPGATIQEPFIVLNPKDEWNRIYLNLTEKTSGNPNNTGIKIFFGFTRDEGVDGDSKVYVDNIKLVY